MHLALSFLERGVMIQFCGAVRVRYHFRFGFLRVQNIGDGINDELRVHSGKTSVVNSSVSDVRCHGIYPRQAVHLALSFSERGVMIQFCGAVRVRYHFRFGFLRVQNIGDGINDELRI